MVGPWAGIVVGAVPLGFTITLNVPNTLPVGPSVHVTVVVPEK
jgi:hypothetical protein